MPVGLSTDGASVMHARFDGQELAVQLNRIVVPRSEPYILSAVCKHSPAAFLKNAKRIEPWDLVALPGRRYQGAEVLSPGQKTLSDCAKGKEKQRWCARYNV